MLNAYVYTIVYVLFRPVGALIEAKPLGKQSRGNQW